jgi:ATP-dependent helicase YprA (DUF1998 family)
MMLELADDATERVGRCCDRQCPWLDELHTYRGRQDADAATLMRRVRDRLCPEKAPVCVGTSATMATEGGDAQRAFGVSV